MARNVVAGEKVKRMLLGRSVLAVLSLCLLAVAPARGAGSVNMDPSPPQKGTRFFDTDRFLTTAGLKYDGTSNLTLEPELGVGYRAQERDLRGGLEEDIHNVHAQAGWRLSLADTLHVSAAAKLPVFTYQSTGRSIGQDPSLHQSYDFGRLTTSNLAWTGEFGIRLSSHADFTLYYDQGLSAGSLPGASQQEDRIGTRIILKFK